MDESYRRSYEPSVKKLSAQPAGATAAGDHGKSLDDAFAELDSWYDAAEELEWFAYLEECDDD